MYMSEETWRNLALSVPSERILATSITFLFVWNTFAHTWCQVWGLGFVFYRHDTRPGSLALCLG